MTRYWRAIERWRGYIYAKTVKTMVVKKVDRSEVERQWVCRGKMKNGIQWNPIPIRNPKPTVSFKSASGPEFLSPFIFFPINAFIFVFYTFLVFLPYFCLIFFSSSTSLRKSQIHSYDASVAVQDHTVVLAAVYFWIELERLRTDM